MKAHELLRNEWKANNKGFKTANGKVVWKEAVMNGDRKRVRISRKASGIEYSRHISPHAEMELVPR